MALLKPTTDQIALNKAASGTRLGAMLYNAIDQGVIPGNRLKFDDQPTAGNTITIGADVYEFRASGNLSDDEHIGVVIGGSASATRTNLVAAINATDANNQHATLFQSDGTTPALANGTEHVVADVVDTDVIHVRPSDRPGGSAFADSPSIVFGENVTAGTVVWQYGNVNMNTLGGRAPGRKFSVTQVTITAAMISLGSLQISAPFTIGGVSAHVKSSAGVERASADTVTFSGSTITIDLDGGASPDIQATDVVTLFIFE